MSRSIEQNYTGSAVAHLPTKILQTEHGIELVVPVTDVIEIIKNAPSIDIVRCKECNHGTYCEEADMYICNANDQDLYEAGHFCSYGERREP